MKNQNWCERFALYRAGIYRDHILPNFELIRGICPFFEELYILWNFAEIGIGQWLFLSYSDKTANLIKFTDCFGNFCEILMTKCIKRIRDLFVMRYINLHFTYLLTSRTPLQHEHSYSWRGIIEHLAHRVMDVFVFSMIAKISFIYFIGCNRKICHSEWQNSTKLARGIWKNLPLKTVVPRSSQCANF